ncbi:MAG: hypothetical protein GXY77_09080 [Fibrobacter sp.]|nr:hypothetical protein [Fibrobacter sp.]
MSILSKNSGKAQYSFPDYPKAVYVISVILWGVTALFSADFFPTDLNRQWIFNYEYRTGHSGGGTNFYGLKYWEIIKKDSSENELTSFTVLEKTELTRKKYQGYWADPFDSVFTEPRVSYDTIVFENDGNIIHNNRDQYFIHDPQLQVPEEICVKDSATEVSGEIENTILTIKGSCDMSQDDPSSKVVKHENFNFFFQKDGIGPVTYIYDSHGTRQLVGGYSWEVWNLRSPVSTQNPENKKIKPHPEWRTSWQGNALYLWNMQNGKKSNFVNSWGLFSINGKMIACGYMQQCGKTGIVMTESTRISLQSMILKITLPDHSVTMPVMYNP